MSVSTNIKKIHLLGFLKGDLFPGKLIEDLKKIKVKNALILGIGGFRRVVIGYFNQEKGYEKIELSVSENEAIEVSSLVGSVIFRDDERYSIHIHVTLGLKTGDNSYASYAGHLIEGVVHPLLEIFLIEVDDINHSILKRIWPHRYK